MLDTRFLEHTATASLLRHPSSPLFFLLCSVPHRGKDDASMFSYICILHRFQFFSQAPTVMGVTCRLSSFYIPIRVLLSSFDPLDPPRNHSSETSDAYNGRTCPYDEVCSLVLQSPLHHRFLTRTLQIVESCLPRIFLQCNSHLGSSSLDREDCFSP